MKKFLLLIAATAFALLTTACTDSSGYTYETVKNDPLKTRIYTLDNGLKVYMSVNKAEPRIETYIAVKVGGKNDPSETTGLAHYFEHLMFKGTQQFGTSNYEAEKPCSTRSNSSSRFTARRPTMRSVRQSTVRSTASATKLRNTPSPTSTTN